MLAEEYDLQVDRETYFDRFASKAESVYARAKLLPGFTHDWTLAERGIPLAVCTSSYPRGIDIVFETNDLGGASTLV